MTIKIYHYPKCSTCKKAVAFLREHGVVFEAVDISLSPPSKDELLAMIGHKGGIRPLFNTSGQSYREGGFSKKVAVMSTEEAIKVLSKDGMLVRRPFVVGADYGLVGFKPEEWAALVA